MHPDKHVSLERVAKKAHGKHKRKPRKKLKRAGAGSRLIRESAYRIGAAAVRGR